MAKTSLGAKLFMGPTGGALVQITQLLSLAPPKFSRDTIDATTHDSTGAQEFIAEGIYDPGELSGQVNYEAGSAGDDLMIAAVTDGELRDFKVVLKSAGGTEDLTFSGYVTSYGPDEMATSGKQTASFGIKVSAAIDQAAS